MLVVWGYWEKNFGDDLFLLSLKQCCSKERILINATRENAEYYRNLGFEVVIKDTIVNRVINRITLHLMSVESYYFKAKNNIFIMLGGSLFAENKPERVEKTQMANLTYAVNKAKQSYIIGSNFGPYKNKDFYLFYKDLFNDITDGCFRDKQSRSLFLDQNKIRYAPDVVLSGLWDTFEYTTLGYKPVVISVMDLSRKEELIPYQATYEKFLADIASYHQMNGEKVVLVSFCEKQGDLDACERIKQRTGNSAISILGYNGIFEMANTLHNARKIYASRFHSIILAMYFGVDCVPLIYDPKSIRAIESYCSKYKAIWIKDIDKVNFRDIVEEDNMLEFSQEIKIEAKKQFSAISDI